MVLKAFTTPTPTGPPWRLSCAIEVSSLWASPSNVALMGLLMTMSRPGRRPIVGSKSRLAAQPLYTRVRAGRVADLVAEGEGALEAYRAARRVVVGVETGGLADVDGAPRHDRVGMGVLCQVALAEYRAHGDAVTVLQRCGALDENGEPLRSVLRG